MSKIITEYSHLVDRINIKILQIVKQHDKHIKCKKRCSSCCLNLTVLPVEFYAIYSGIKSQQLKIKKIHFNEQHSCGFLKNDLCQIYPFRPIICRTHGYPVSFYDPEISTESYQVSYCEKNFKSEREMETAFNSENTLDIDRINQELQNLNKKYLKINCHNHPDIQNFQTEKYSPHSDRIPLKNLLYIKSDLFL